jgi:hypothetical protein
MKFKFHNLEGQAFLRALRANGLALKSRQDGSVYYDCLLIFNGDRLGRASVSVTEGSIACIVHPDVNLDPISSMSSSILARRWVKRTWVRAKYVAPRKPKFRKFGVQVARRLIHAYCREQIPNIMLS